ncbi:hypothetical protein Barb4_04390 [Bacteroidales bacterium Barb4]|nr:hypothetical protein Barb4_04390 [Bacteroidales bacterium Barb4]
MPRIVNPSPKVTESSNPHPLKAFDPHSFMLPGMITERRDLQPSKADVSRTVNPSSKMTDSR